jgi:hypothetical protein
MAFQVMKNEHVVLASTCNFLGPHWNSGGEEGRRKIIDRLAECNTGSLAQMYH